LGIAFGDVGEEDVVFGELGRVAASVFLGKGFDIAVNLLRLNTSQRQRLDETPESGHELLAYHLLAILAGDHGKDGFVLLAGGGDVGKDF
jgi:hypothetical protein